MGVSSSGGGGGGNGGWMRVSVSITDCSGGSRLKLRLGGCTLLGFQIAPPPP